MCCVQVLAIADPNQHPQAREWRILAEADWNMEGHGGWQVLTDQVVSGMMGGKGEGGEGGRTIML